jgi:hypothetical protein
MDPSVDDTDGDEPELQPATTPSANAATEAARQAIMGVYPRGDPPAPERVRKEMLENEGAIVARLRCS